ncbi:hypothetical protein AVEN_273475-1 [Araneus ventricosus]|uniref:Uncharacterized protein n=1 Tax=Araneus ventricosus TaxID=182803 RepID=A0A4Y2MD83_ARAVE|nr:hypothetical protein AVEN_273475-1 [Araneus ventricosus]
MGSMYGGSSVESGFEPGALRPPGRDLTTRPSRPLRILNGTGQRKQAQNAYEFHQHSTKLNIKQAILCMYTKKSWGDFPSGFMKKKKDLPIVI